MIWFYPVIGAVVLLALWIGVVAYRVKSERQPGVIAGVVGTAIGVLASVTLSFGLDSWLGRMEAAVRADEQTEAVEAFLRVELQHVIERLQEKTVPGQEGASEFDIWLTACSPEPLRDAAVSGSFSVDQRLEIYKLADNLETLALLSVRALEMSTARYASEEAQAEAEAYVEQLSVGLTQQRALIREQSRQLLDGLGGAVGGAQPSEREAPR